MIDKIRNNAFAKNSLILLIGTLAASVLGYVFHLVIGRMVSATVYGEVESLISFAAIISVPAGSLTMVVTKLSAGHKADNNAYASRQFLSWYNRKVILYGLPVFFLAIIASPYLKNFLKMESTWPLIVVWLMMLVSFFNVATGGLLSGWQKFAGCGWAGVWGALIKLISALVLIYLGFNLLGAVGGFAFGALATYLISLFFLRFIYKTNQKNENWEEKMKSAFSKKNLWPIFWGNLAIAILSNVDMVLAKHNLPLEVAGQYGALTIISKIVFFVISVIATVLFSMSSEDNHKNSNSRHTLNHALLLTFIISAAAFFAYYLFPQLIMSLLFGSKYKEVAFYLAWFAFSVIIFSFVNLIFQYLISVNETRVAYFLLVISLAASLAALFVGKSIFAIITVMIAAQSAGVLFCLYFLHKKSKKAIV